MTVAVEAWYDDDAGPLVRLYARAGGRVHATRDDLELNTIIYHVPGRTAAPNGLTPDARAALRLCGRPVALSEVAAKLGLPIEPARRVIAELRDAGLVTVRRPGGDQADRGVVLQRLLGGLRSL